MESIVLTDGPNIEDPEFEEIKFNPNDFNFKMPEASPRKQPKERKKIVQKKKRVVVQKQPKVKKPKRKKIVTIPQELPK